MKKLVLTLIIAFTSFNIFACENIQYQLADSAVVSPRRVEPVYVSMLPFRGMIQFIKVVRTDGIIEPLDVRNAYITHDYGKRTDIRFDYNDDFSDDGIVSELFLSRYDRVQEIYLELSNRSIMLGFYEIHVGVCRD